MTTYINIHDRLLKSFEREQPKVGKYRASGLYYLLNEPIENFFNPKEFTPEAIAGMFRGTLRHRVIQELLPDCECEKEKILTIDDFVLSAHCDVITPQKELWEIKTTINRKVRDRAYYSQIYQLRVYLSMFECQHGKIIQPVFVNNQLKLKVLAEVERNDEWFNGEIEKLKLRHNEIKNYAVSKI